MSEDRFIHYIQIIRQQIEVLHKYMMPLSTQEEIAEALEKITASLENLQLSQEEMQANLEVIEVIEEELQQQSEHLAVESQFYYDLFQFAPDAYLLTNPQGVILKANRAAATLLNVLHTFLIGKPLALFVHKPERLTFRSKLNELSLVDSVQEWEIVMCPRGGQLFDASLMVAPIRNTSGRLVSLQISIRDVTKYKQVNLQQQPATATQLLPEAAAIETPRSLDGLRVLFVDDEANAREFITVVLEQHGISVTAVASVAEALSVLERSRPDVIISDIRMPDEDGYALIEKVRAIEAEKGWHIPTAALTAYLAEDRAKALKAGFQSHLHKLAEPTELVAMVAQLAGRR